MRMRSRCCRFCTGVASCANWGRGAAVVTVKAHRGRTGVAPEERLRRSEGPQGSGVVRAGAGPKRVSRSPRRIEPSGPTAAVSERNGARNSATPIRALRTPSRQAQQTREIHNWGGWTRTTNFLINSQAVCQLTYAPSCQSDIAHRKHFRAAACESGLSLILARRPHEESTSIGKH